MLLGFLCSSLMRFWFLLEMKDKGKSCKTKSQGDFSGGLGTFGSWLRMLLGFGGSGGCCCNRFKFFDALDAGGFAAQLAQITQLGATDAALAYYFD